jgi:hypothetical protein
MTRVPGIVVVAMLWLPIRLPAQGEGVARHPLPAASFRVTRSSWYENPQADGQRATGNGQRATLLHYGKWLTAGTAVAFTWMGAHEHARSADAWDALVTLCRANNARCTLGADGRYLDAIAEEHYQRSLRYDRRARTRLLLGQGALLLTIGFFLLDRPQGDDGPENIPVAPFEVSADPRTGGVRVGMRIGF